MQCSFVGLVVLCALGVAAPVLAQADAGSARDSTVVVRLRDGSQIVGRLVEQTPDSVRLVTSAGRMTLTRSAVTELKVINPADIHDGSYWPVDPHETRLFFGPSPAARSPRAAATSPTCISSSSTAPLD
jgi:hypothetical protein